MRFQTRTVADKILQSIVRKTFGYFAAVYLARGRTGANDDGGPKIAAVLKLLTTALRRGIAGGGGETPECPQLKFIAFRCSLLQFRVAPPRSCVAWKGPRETVNGRRSGRARRRRGRRGAETAASRRLM